MPEDLVGAAFSRLEKYNTYRMRLLEATPNSLQGYGAVVEDYDAANVAITPWPAQGWRPVDPGTGNQGGVVEGIYDVWWQDETLYGRNHAVNDSYVFGWSRDPNLAPDPSPETKPKKLLFWHANYHPDGGQIFFPTERKPFVVPLALPGDDVKPEDFIAFYCDGSFGVNVHAGVWHEAPFPCAGQSSFKDKQGAVHARISCDFVEEFGLYLEVPLRQPD